MSPTTKPHRDLKVNVPRHNSQRIGPVLTENVEKVAVTLNVRVDVSQTALDPTSALAQAIESASEWNSLLMTARAERGPQWDVGTQLFHVDEYSDLYYDQGPLQPESQQTNSDEHPSSNHSHREQETMNMNSPSLVRTNSMPSGGMPSSLSQAQLYGTPQAMASPRHPFPGPSAGMPYGMSGIPPSQFYGTSDGISASAMQRPPAGMGIPPMGMGMGMGGIPDGSMSPEVRRRVTRGMGMSDYGNMHG